MKFPTRTLISLSLLALLAACGGGSTGGGVGGASGDLARDLFTACESPRSQVCTRDYRPVCGVSGTGELDTFPNACTACANHAVDGYFPGACSLPGMTACTEPRPQLCTADYRPACGASVTGELKTYGNACSACGDAAVIGFVDGECPVVQ